MWMLVLALTSAAMGKDFLVDESAWAPDVVEGDPHLDGDAVYAVKDSLVGKYQTVNDASEARKLGLPNPFLKLNWDFRLSPESGVKARKKIAASDAVA